MVVEVFVQESSAVFFGRSGFGAVVVGQVEVRDAVVECGEHQGLHLVVGRDVAEVVPEAQRYGRELQAAGAAALVQHGVVARRGGRVGAGGFEHGCLQVSSIGPMSPLSRFKLA